MTVVSGNTFVGDANASDPNGDPLTYSISGGADANLFVVNAQTGVVSFINAPTYVSGGDNSYQLILRVSDGTLYQDRVVNVEVVANNGGGGN
ncbi:MAG: cadherin repeat domain-containing protein [Planctomycetaceae bacterium]